MLATLGLRMYLSLNTLLTEMVTFMFLYICWISFLFIIVIEWLFQIAGGLSSWGKYQFIFYRVAVQYLWLVADNPIFSIGFPCLFSSFFSLPMQSRHPVSLIFCFLLSFLPASSRSLCVESRSGWVLSFVLAGEYSISWISSCRSC